MKKILLLFFCLGTLNIGYARSFGPKNYRLGGCLYYASEIKSVGLGVTGTYIFADIIEGAASLSYVLKNDYLSWGVLDLDAHYLFYEYDKSMRVYALGGFSGVYSKYNKPAQTITDPNNPFADPITIPESKSTSFNVGFNIGAGLNYKFADNLMFLPEFKFTINENSFIRLVLNLQYTF